MNLTPAEFTLGALWALIGIVGVYLVTRIISAAWHRSMFQAMARFERKRNQVKEETNGNR